jgi:hypothetical protein
VRAFFAAALILFACAAPLPARAWGDEGHRVVALIADSLLRPDVRRRVNAMLATDTDSLTAHDIASEATWADAYREADIDGSRMRTRQWHFVDIEIYAPSLDEACFKHKPLPPGTLASLGPQNSCVVDKINQFAAELADPQTEADERLFALKFLLHLVGDIHQPLHASDDEDHGGNRKHITASGFRSGNLHHYWDTEFVAALGSSPAQIAASLRAQISPAQIRDWSRGAPADWAMQSFALARDDGYGQLPPAGSRGGYRLGPAYIDMAVRDVRLQLARAGVRLAAVLNRTLGQR